MRRVEIGGVSVSRLCIGGNPFSGFSHQSPERDREMLEYFTPERIHATLRAAEAAGINTVFARTDEHIFRVLSDYRRAGGAIQWFAQVCCDRRDDDSWKTWMDRAADLGATALYLHGGVADYWHAQGWFDRFEEALERMRGHGCVAGFAGHRPAVHEWIRDRLDVDFQMCSHYNPTDRTRSPHHVNVGEKWHPDDRDAMLRVVATVPRPVVHYKVFAGGNRPVVEAFETLARAMRPNDAVCIGIFPKDDPDMLQEDIALLEEHVERQRTAERR